MRRTRLYLSGGMTGYPDFNFPFFNRWANRLRDAGYIVVNPADNYGGDHGRPRRDYIRMDIEAVLGVDGIAVLPGWTTSPGALLETAIAKELELPIHTVQYWWDKGEKE
jgi:hypothetical protein